MKIETRKPKKNFSVIQPPHTSPDKSTSVGAQQAKLNIPQTVLSGALPDQYTVLSLQRLIGNRATRELLMARDSLPAVSGGVNGDIQRATGLAGKGNIKQYAKSVKNAKAGWDSKDRLGRIGLFFDPIRAMLSRLEVPDVLAMPAADPSLLGAGDKAAFMRATWTIQVRPSILDANSITDTEFAYLANIFYHECRHAEQIFRVARLLAAQEVQSDAIARRLTIKADIARAASAKRLDPKNEKEWKEAVSWRNAIDKGPKEEESEDRIVNVRKEAATSKYFKARRLYRQYLLCSLHDPKADPATQRWFDEETAKLGGTEWTNPILVEAKEQYAQAREKAIDAFQKYVTMSVEADAWAIGAKVQKALKQRPHTARQELDDLTRDTHEILELAAQLSKRGGKVLTYTLQ